MGLSYRLFLLDPNDTIYRLANAKFARMLLDPTSYRFPPFAGHRIRSADTIVALEGRTPVQVLRITCGMLIFDDKGCLDVQTLWRRQSARLEVVMGSVLCPTKGDTNVVETASQFIVQGDRWTLSGALAERVGAAALGEIKCPRL